MSNVLLAFRDNERDLEVLQQMRDEEGWDNWLPVAELSLIEIPEFAEFISKELSICELAVVEIMKLKLSLVTSTPVELSHQIDNILHKLSELDET